MAGEERPPAPDNRWSRISWWSLGGVCIASFLVGFVLLGRFQQNGPTLGTWAAICRAIGIGVEVGPAGEPQPPRRTPTRIAWTRSALARIASGDERRGALVAAACADCHGEHGVSSSTLIPTLAGMDSAAIFKQLDDYRSKKRLWGVMTAIATSLNDRESADVAEYFAHLSGGLPQAVGEGAPESGHSLRQRDPTIRLIFVGDPERGIPPCAACHGPSAQKLGAPALRGQHAAYIERQLAAFAQGTRKNDINEQMRVIAQGLTPDEMHTIAAYYGDASQASTAKDAGLNRIAKGDRLSLNAAGTSYAARMAE